MPANLYKVKFIVWQVFLFLILGLIVMYGSFKHNQTYRSKAWVMKWSANQCAPRDSMEGSGPPHLDFYVLRH
jgi:hypothetical protein